MSLGTTSPAPAPSAAEATWIEVGSRLTEVHLLRLGSALDRRVSGRTLPVLASPTRDDEPPVTLDLRRVTDLSATELARLAEVVDGRWPWVHLPGLRDHQRVLLRYLGVTSRPRTDRLRGTASEA